MEHVQNYTEPHGVSNNPTLIHFAAAIRRQGRLGMAAQPAACAKAWWCGTRPAADGAAQWSAARSVPDSGPPAGSGQWPPPHLAAAAFTGATQFTLSLHRDGLPS